MDVTDITIYVLLALIYVTGAVATWRDGRRRFAKHPVKIVRWLSPVLGGILWPLMAVAMILDS